MKQLLRKKGQRPRGNGRLLREAGCSSPACQTVDKGRKRLCEVECLVRGQGGRARSTSAGIEHLQEVARVVALDRRRADFQLRGQRRAAKATVEEPTEWSALLALRPPDRRLGFVGLGCPRVQQRRDDRAVGSERRCRPLQECPGGEIPVSRGDGLGEALFSRRGHQVIAERHRVGDALGAFLLRGSRIWPRPAYFRIHEKDGEGVEGSRWSEGLGLLDGEPHRRIVQESTVEEVAPTELKRLATMRGAVRGTAQFAEWLARHRSRALHRSHFALTVAAGQAALAQRPRSEGEGECCRGKQRLDRLVRRDEWTGGIDGLGECRRISEGRGEREAGVAAESRHSGGIHFEDERDHCLL